MPEPALALLARCAALLPPARTRRASPTATLRPALARKSSTGVPDDFPVPDVLAQLSSAVRARSNWRPSRLFHRRSAPIWSLLTTPQTAPDANLTANTRHRARPFAIPPQTRPTN